MLLMHADIYTGQPCYPPSESPGYCPALQSCYNKKFNLMHVCFEQTLTIYILLQPHSQKQLLSNLFPHNLMNTASDFSQYNQLKLCHCLCIVFCIVTTVTRFILAISIAIFLYDRCIAQICFHKK